MSPRHTRRPLLYLAAVLMLFTASAALAQFSRDPFAETGGMILFGSRITPHILGGIVGLLIGAFFSPAFRHIRRLIGAILLAVVILFALFGPFPLADFVNGWLALGTFLAALYFGLRLGYESAAGRSAPPPTSFGSAKWADFMQLNTRNMIGSGGFMLGEFVDRGPDNRRRRSPLTYTGARHLLTVAPTRSGKGVSSIIPNLLTYEGSAFVIDPKGENALVTAPRRGSGTDSIPGMGQSVFLLDPWNIAAGKLGLRPANFNPLDWITAGDPDAAENALLLADALVPEENRTGGENRFWDEEAKAFLTGIILYVATAPEEEGQRHLGRVRDILVMDEDDLMAVLNRMANHPHPVVSSTADRTVAKEPKLRSNVITGTQAHTHFLDSPRIRSSLERTDFRFEDLKTTRISVYLILPADRLKTFDRWLRLLVQQAIMVNARNIDQKPDKPVLFLLDEMAAIGKLSSVEQAYGLMAGFGMQLWGIVQDLSQLERIYDKGWQTFISNSGVIQYFGSRDKMTAEYFSHLCGVTTVIVRNLSWAVGEVIAWTSSVTSSFQGSSSTSGSSQSLSNTETTSHNESQRKLAYPDELMVLKGDRQIIFIENLDPIQADKVTWYQHPGLTTLGVNLHAPAADPPATPEPVEPITSPMALDADTAAAWDRLASSGKGP